MHDKWAGEVHSAGIADQANRTTTTTSRRNTATTTYQRDKEVIKDKIDSDERRVPLARLPHCAVHDIGPTLLRQYLEHRHYRLKTRRTVPQLHFFQTLQHNEHLDIINIRLKTDGIARAIFRPAK